MIQIEWCVFSQSLKLIRFISVCLFCLRGEMCPRNKDLNTYNETALLRFVKGVERVNPEAQNRSACFFLSHLQPSSRCLDYFQEGLSVCLPHLVCSLPKLSRKDIARITIFFPHARVPSKAFPSVCPSVST